jgi:hypothetical protein
MKKSNSFQCASCGNWHDEIPLDFGAEVRMPSLRFILPGAIPVSAEIVNSLWWTIDLILSAALLKAPLSTMSNHSVGASGLLSAKSFKRMIEMLDNAEHVQDPPCFGRLSTPLPYPETTLNLKTMFHTQQAGLRPKIEPELSSHPLALKQKTALRWNVFSKLLNSYCMVLRFKDS